MKAIKTILKIVSALIFVAGAAYVVATYGDKIVAWAKKLLNGCCCKNTVEVPAEEAAEEESPVEEPAAEEAPAEEAPAEEAPAEEAPADNAPVASDADFEG